MTILWTTTKADPAMFRPANLTREIEAALRAAVGVDPAILALALGINPQHVMAFQRKLGLRKLTSPSSHRKVRQ